MHDTAETVRAWLSSGHQVAVARVTNRTGFSGDTELELLACNGEGDTTGDLLGGTQTVPRPRTGRKAVALRTTAGSIRNRTPAPE